MQKFRQHLSYHSILLGGLALVAGTLLAWGNHITLSEIADRQNEDLNASIAQVVPDALHDNDMLTDTVSISSEDKGSTKVYRARLAGSVSAIAFEVPAYGYSSPPIQLILGIDRNGSLLGVRVLSHAETPGLGDKIEEKKADWIFSFTGKSLDDPSDKGWAVKKDGGIFDQFTGATITPRGVVKAVHAGLQFFAQHKTLMLDETQHSDNSPGRRRKDETMDKEAGHV